LVHAGQPNNIDHDPLPAFFPRRAFVMGQTGS
jgi:hypothetical protein